MSCKYNNCKICGYESECEIYKENAELKNRNAELKGMYAHSAREAGTYKQFFEQKEKENAELKGEADSVLDNWCKGNDPCPHLKKRDEQLTNAKEIIKKLYAVYYDPCVTESDLKYRDELFAELKQFISEVEK